MSVNQMGKDCLQLIQKKLSGKIGKDEYYLELLELDKKYPLPGRNPPLTSSHFKHPERFRVYVEHNGTKFADKIRPSTFKEAAEFYAQNGREDPVQISWVDREPGEEG